MFVLCQHCQFLVALDPVSGEPPSHCPRCAGRLRPDSGCDTAAPAPAAGGPVGPVVDTGPDAIRTATSAPILDDPAATDHDDGAGSADISDQALADDVIAGEVLTDEPAMVEMATVEPVITQLDAVELDAVELDAVELDAVLPDPLQSDAVEPGVAEPDTAKPDTVKLDTAGLDASDLASAHPSVEAGPVDSPDADPTVEDDFVAIPHGTGDRDQDPIGTQQFDPVEDAQMPPMEPADSLIESMLGPAAIEIEAATATIGQMPAEPIDGPRTDAPQSSGNVAETAPNLVIQDLEPAIGPTADPTPAPAQEPEDFPATTPLPPAPATRKPAPSFVRGPPAASGVASRQRWLAAVAIALLTLALLLQLLLADRARLATDARWRPALSTLCGALHCALPPWREPAAFTLLRRDVRPHPTLQGALQVTATFRNDARWAQPWPGVLLTLSDVDGRVVAARTFLPREYLDARTTGAAGASRTLASGHSKAVVLDIVEPTPRIVAFTFDFL